MNPPRTACATCPWRKTTPSGGFPGGHIKGAALRAMASDQVMSRVMECHSGKVADPRVCVGFAVVVGYKSLGFRFAQTLGLLDNYCTDPTPFHPTIDALLSFHPNCSTDTNGDEEESTNG